MAAGLQSCSWHFCQCYCWPAAQLPVWPLLLTPESSAAPCCGLLQLWWRKHSGGAVLSDHFIASYFDTTNHLRNWEGQASPPLQRISMLCWEAAGCQNMESRSRAAPLIREVLPDSFSKHFSKETGCTGSKLGGSHEKCHCFQRQSTAQDRRCQTLLDPVVNPLKAELSLKGTDKPKRVKVVPSCQPPSLPHIPGEIEPPSPQQPTELLRCSADTSPGSN